MVLSPESRSLLPINTHKRLFQPTRLQFGIHFAPGMFQREIEDFLKSVPFVKIRPEDILISGKNDEEHLKTLETVLEIISSNGLKLNLKKCMFMQPEVTYFGNSIIYRVNKHGIFLLPEKVDFSKNVSPLQNVSELKSFLGLINYYHRHLPSFSTVLEPLNDLFRKNKKWKWGSTEEERFQECKLLLNESNLLIHYDPKKPLLVACDASP